MRAAAGRCAKEDRPCEEDGSAGFAATAKNLRGEDRERKAYDGGEKRADAGQTAKEESLFGPDKTRIADFGIGKRKREMELSKRDNAAGENKWQWNGG